MSNHPNRSIRHIAAECVGQFHVAPQNQGQIVTYSYAADAEDGTTIFEAVYDASDRTEVVRQYRAPAAEQNRDADFWNRVPKLGRCLGRVIIDDAQ